MIDLRPHGAVKITPQQRACHHLVGQTLRLHHDKTAKGIAQRVAERELIVVIVRGDTEQPIALPQHLVIALRIKPVQPVVLTAVIIDLHSPEAPEIFVVVVVLQRPVGMIVAGVKAVLFHFLNIFVDIIRVVVSPLWKQVSPFFLHKLFRCSVIQIHVVRLYMRKIPRPLKMFVDIDLHGGQRQKILVTQIPVPLIMPVVRDRYDLIPPLPVCLPDLLRRQMPVRVDRVAVQVRLVDLSFFWQ